MATVLLETLQLSFRTLHQGENLDEFWANSIVHSLKSVHHWSMQSVQNAPTECQFGLDEKLSVLLYVNIVIIELWEFIVCTCVPQICIIAKYNRMVW